MGNGRDNGWETDNETYSPEQVEAILEYCGVKTVGDTNTHFLAYCPFHGNTDSPAFACDKYKGLWTCFNPSCMTAGTLEELIRRLKKLNVFQVARLILKYKDANNHSLSERVDEALAKPVEFVPFPQEPLDRMYRDFKGSVGQQYMRSRGFNDDTLDYFRVGYSAKKNMVIVPMHDPKGMPIGLIGRTASHTDKAFKNSTNLPKSLTTWNFHRARRTGDTVIVVEASYDAMRVHQAGYPNVVALLGGHITSHHIQQLSRTFSKVIIMTDFDPKQYRPNCRMCNYNPCKGHRPGRDLGRQIANIPNIKVLWSAYDDTCVYPHGAKDVGDLTDNEIRQCLKNAISNLEYSMWNIEDQTVAVTTDV
jgi:DNA primase